MTNFYFFWYLQETGQNDVDIQTDRQIYLSGQLMNFCVAKKRLNLRVDAHKIQVV